MKQNAALLALCLLTFGSCTKIRKDNASTSSKQIGALARSSDEIRSEIDAFYESEGVDPSKVSYEYFMDGAPVDFNPDFDYSAFYPAAHGTYNEADQSLHIACNFFTSREGYIEYGVEKGLPLESLMNFENTVQEYVTTHDLSDIDTEEELPESYKDFEAGAFASIWPVPNPVWLQVYDDFIAYGPMKNLHIKYLPTLKKSKKDNWNNKISCIKLTAGYSVVALYDKTFFGKHLLTVSGWYGTVYSFWSGSGGLYPWVDNKVESIVIQ